MPSFVSGSMNGWHPAKRTVDAYRSVERVWTADGRVGGGAAFACAGRSSMSPQRRRNRAGLGLAATVLAACLALYFLPDLKLRLQADHLTGVAELRELTLEDGSVVHLDAAQRHRRALWTAP